MDLKDKLNSLFSKLRCWLKLQIIAVITLLCAITGHAAVVPIEEYALDSLGASINTESDKLNLSLDYSHDYISNWLDVLRETKQDCQPYVSVLDNFYPCTPSMFQSDLITDSEDRNLFFQSNDAKHGG